MMQNINPVEIFYDIKEPVLKNVQLETRGPFYAAHKKIILALLLVLIGCFNPSKVLSAGNDEIIFNSRTEITVDEISRMLADLIQAVENEDAELFRSFIDDFHNLTLSNIYWEEKFGHESLNLVLDKYFDAEVMDMTRHYCFGAGVEDVPLTVWELLTPVTRIEGKEIEILNYAPHPEELSDLYGHLIVYPDTSHIYPSLSFGIDAAFKVWQVGDYYHGLFNGLEIFFCHSMDSNEWFISEMYDY